MIIFLFLTLSALSAFLFLPTNAANFALYFQEICKKMSPVHSEYQMLYAATICGINPPPSQIIWDFRNAGLYHLIVVSGAHLIFCAVLIEKLLCLCPRPWRTLLVFIFLFSYSLFSGMNPPVVRALIAFALFTTAEKLKLNWNASVGVLLSGLVSLVIFPSWWSSLSFLMSWSAAFALTTTSSPLMKCAAVYILMLLPMSGLGLNSPTTIFLNWLLAPILGFIVLPISFLPFIHPQFSILTDPVWRILIYIVEFLSRLSTTATQAYRLPFELMWTFLIGLQLSFYKYYVTRKRKEF